MDINKGKNIMPVFKVGDKVIFDGEPFRGSRSRYTLDNPYHIVVETFDVNNEILGIKY